MFNDRCAFHIADMNCMNNAIIRIEREGTFSPVLNSKPSRRVQGVYLTFRRLMSYIYGAPILDVSRSHTTTQHNR